jgi:hypothetical protein
MHLRDFPRGNIPTIDAAILGKKNDKKPGITPGYIFSC